MPDTAPAPTQAAPRSIYPHNVAIGLTQRPGSFFVDVRIEADSFEDLETAIAIYRDQWRVYDPVIGAPSQRPDGRWQALGSRSEIGE